MSVFTLAIACLTTSNLPWFMDLIFQVPMQYCSLQHQTLLPSPVTSTTGCCFCFGSISSFFLEFISPLFSSSIFGTYWPGEFIFQCSIFLGFHTVGGSQGKYTKTALPFPSPRESTGDGQINIAMRIREFPPKHNNCELELEDYDIIRCHRDIEKAH